MRWALLPVIAACAAHDPPATGSRTVTYLTPTEHLVRASMALRGVRPSLAELQAVAKDPGQLPHLVDTYLDSPEFGDTIRDLHNEVLLLRVQRPELTPSNAGPLGNRSFGEVTRSYFDEPLRLIEDVVMNDRPYTEIVTADYTMADDIVAAIYGMPHGPGSDWERVAWPDGRPAAGILVSDAFHARYRSAGFNYHRGRANAVARSMLCHDFLDGDVIIDPTVNLADPNVVANAVVQNPSCAACHQTLDPLASYFFGYQQGVLNLDAIGGYPFTIYDATQTNDWFLTTDRPPSYFGQDAVGLDGLGKAIAADPRFTRCAAIHFASYLTEVDPANLSPAWIAQLQAVFEQHHDSAKQLARAIVLSDPFRIASDSDPTDAETAVGYQKARPAQLSRMLYALTGYRWLGQSNQRVVGEWPIGTIDLLDDDYSGFRVLGGGIDSFLVTEPVFTMNATSSMVTRVAAFSAAQFVVDHDASVPLAQRTLLTAADPAATDEGSVRAELAELHARIFGELVDPSDPELDASYALYQGALAASGDARRAWVVTLTGMLSDLKAVYY
ncbi:MAG TPA: hypothetical protein VLX92_05595 [Kofleriaceae bacterium]|nr:hypothetical protein [Kofleriaceae bacterium]